MFFEEQEEKARNAASEAYHSHPSNPSSCPCYEEHAAFMSRNNTRCPCENDWREYIEDEES